MSELKYMMPLVEIFRENNYACLFLEKTLDGILVSE